jgi:hypothetical protein
MNDFLARGNFNVWAEAVKSGEPEKVVALCSRSIVFLPTLSGKIRRGHEETGDYFNHFLTKKPSCTLIEDAITPIDDRTYCHSGKYNFELDKNGERVIFPARFSFIWKLKNDNWKIIHFHSSANPE